MRAVMRSGSSGVVIMIYHIMSHELISETIVRLTAVKASYMCNIKLSRQHRVMGTDIRDR